MENKLIRSLVFISGLAWASTDGMAQVISTEEKFQDLFVSAGYGTVYGAALGAALLSFQPKPENNLRLVALGASVGFISGSLLGSYIIISPTLESAVPDTKKQIANAPAQRARSYGLEVSYKVLTF